MSGKNKVKFLSNETGERSSADVIVDGGMQCGNCIAWRILKHRPMESPMIERCWNCGDEEFDLWPDDELPPEAFATTEGLVDAIQAAYTTGQISFEEWRNATDCRIGWIIARREETGLTYHQTSLVVGADALFGQAIKWPDGRFSVRCFSLKDGQPVEFFATPIKPESVLPNLAKAQRWALNALFAEADNRGANYGPTFQAWE